MNWDRANEAWLKTMLHVKEKGRLVSPRGLESLEVMSHKTSFDMHHPIVTETKRKLGYKFMAAEALWITSGSNRLDFHPEIREKLGKYSDDGETMAGAYGPRYVEQLNWVWAQFKRDRGTRQAIIEVWRPKPPESKDIPCTIALQFMIRKDMLHLNAFMRSSDVWMGIPYDMFSYTCMAHEIAMGLGDVTLGECNITSGSCHLYMSDMGKVQEVLYMPREHLVSMPLDPTKDIYPVLQKASLADTQLQAREILQSWRAS